MGLARRVRKRCHRGEWLAVEEEERKRWNKKKGEKKKKGGPRSDLSEAKQELETCHESCEGFECCFYNDEKEDGCHDTGNGDQTPAQQMMRYWKVMSRVYTSLRVHKYLDVLYNM
ncbi:hypothetical protein Acr_17g0003030 [Actinidia rufa]|uniref:Uncharacterized protein n=1 Tax=Actinidia rufa TaxID=165716 RepID=A0A7J0G1S1_9ERIC|nr:hypothetical protein Acr_17g0003030 [Actinidia rufa]